MKGTKVQPARGRFPSGWMNGAELRWLQAQGAKSRLAIEIGSFRGRSATAIATELKGTLYCVDSWVGKREREYARFMRNMSKQIRAKTVQPVRMDSPAAAAVLLEQHGPTFDFIFIDGAHNYEGCSADIAAYRPLLRPGGLLAGHDFHTSQPGVVRSVIEAFGVPTLGPGSIWSIVP